MLSTRTEARRGTPLTTMPQPSARAVSALARTILKKRSKISGLREAAELDEAVNSYSIRHTVAPSTACRRGKLRRNWA